MWVWRPKKRVSKINQKGRDIEDMQGLGELGEDADVEDNGPNDEFWPNCCAPGVDYWVTQKGVSADEEAQLEKEEGKAKHMYEQSMWKGLFTQSG